METKVCNKCGLTKPITEFHTSKVRTKVYIRGRCKECLCKEHLEYVHRRGLQTPMSQKSSGGPYLGIFIAERVASHYFDNVKRTPFGTPGYDLICSKNRKIDVKSACLRICGGKSTGWNFHIRHNTIADYFMCLGFDNRDDLNPLHIWLIPGMLVNMQSALWITSYDPGLSKWSAYEKPIGRVIACCEDIRS